MHTFREIKNNYNLIEILDEDFESKIPKDFKTNKVIDGDCVIKFKKTISNKTVSTYALLDIENSTIEAYFYFHESYKFKLAFKVKVENDNVKSFDDLDWIYLADEDRKGCEVTLAMIFNAMAYISYKLSEKKTRYKTERKQNKPSDKNKVQYNRKKVYVLNEDKVVYLNISSDDNFIKGLRNYTRKSEAWNVVGHYRKLKNGKMVWIPPYKKGNKLKDVEPRKYIVK